MPGKLTLVGGVWVETPATIIDVLNPTVVMASVEGNIFRLLAYFAIAKVTSS